MNIKELVAEYQLKTKELITANPGMDEIRWEVKEIPYQDFRQYIDEYNAGRKGSFGTLTENDCNDKVFSLVSSGNNSCTVVLWTVPVKIKRVFEVEELTPVIASQDNEVNAVIIEPA